ncbi:MAG: DUF4143 domain-containing protein [Alphaproteobacteria bacterium]|nr:DUF4143 domain-containing protein [Alphaproteobacteria bacterium]
MKKEYLSRVIDKELSEKLGCVGAILIVGPKWCGKTTTASQISKSILQMQNPDKTMSYIKTAQTKPSLLLKGDNPRLIDEWQMAPVLWDAVRYSVDERDEFGLYILTGSTVVDEKAIMHSGTGRISRLIMYPMSLYESKESNGTISLSKLFLNPNEDIDGITSDLSIENLIFAACRGGWPSSLKKITKQQQLFDAYNYLNNICETDASSIDGVKRSPQKVRGVLRSYARNISTIATTQTILNDINMNFSDISIATLSSYLNVLEKLFVVSDIPAWCPAIRSKTVIRSSSKREFIDPSIAVAALDLSPEMLEQDLNTFGFIFECLCIRDLKIYSQSMGGYLNYYRDRLNLEADCVLHLQNGQYALIEFKLGSRDIEEGASHLKKLKSLIAEANLKTPDLLMVITGGEMAYTREDGVKIVPIGCLCP